MRWRERRGEERRGEEEKRRERREEREEKKREKRREKREEKRRERREERREEKREEIPCCQPWHCTNHKHQQICAILPRNTAQASCQHVFEDKGFAKLIPHLASSKTMGISDSTGGNANFRTSDPISHNKVLACGPYSWWVTSEKVKPKVCPPSGYSCTPLSSAEIVGLLCWRIDKILSSTGANTEKTVKNISACSKKPAKVRAGPYTGATG
ncbi:hypothetical protein DUI87_25254 [Hirundo rustica rustica]|uniref:Uncharacterized protein n=1 Tax=Hirundo rustica rustica TaxID=333673 RepID=A0A3M0JBS0_HIRRU|nr:hypothetical protein DUI87_25254 [Hirundo rustica rustica]